MSNKNHSFIIFILHVLFTNIAHSQCAAYFSYCLSGMHPGERYAGICSNYEYVSIDEGCKYFKHTQNEWYFDLYIHWSETYDVWIVGPNISNAYYYAYCFNDALDEYALDGCTSGHWYLYSPDTGQTAVNYDLTIEPCDYNNTECEATYIDSNIGASDFCVSHTFHRAVNKNIAGLYSISGCSEEQPYYNKNGGALAWDNELDAWFIAASHNITAFDHYAFCTEKDIANCDQKWYIWNGYASELDTNVVSGYCDTCTDISYDNVCVYFTESSSSMQFIEGTYTFDQCIQLKSGYSKVNQNTLTLHYVAENHTFVIDDNYNSFSLYAKCMNSTAITDCNTDASWFVRNQSSYEFAKESTMRIEVRACQDLYETTESIVSTTATATATTTTHSQCASYSSYCLSGMHPYESNAFICGNYVYVGYDEGCRYFKYTNEWYFDIYIHWSQAYDKWYIGRNISNTRYYAYCYDDALDDCTNGHWYLYSPDVGQTAINSDLTIEPCNYNNTQCIATYIDSNNIDTYDFCVSHTFHRAVNGDIAGLYSVSGCNEEEPYYNKHNGDAIAWDNELDAWFLSDSHNVPAYDHYAFCAEKDIANCNKIWYIWNGDESELDTNVVSGYCDTCTDVSHDNVCVYSTESSSSMQFIEGTYAFDQCIQLKSGYSKVNHNSLTLHYVAENNTFVIDDNSDSFSLYAKCMNSTAITDCNTDASWFVRINPFSSEFTKESTMRIEVGACQDLYETTESIASTTATTATATTTAQTTAVTQPRTSHTDTTSTAACGEKATLATAAPIGIDSGLLIVIIISGAVIILACAVLLLFGFFCYRRRRYHYKEVKPQKQQYSQVPSTAATIETTGQRTTGEEQPLYTQSLYEVVPV